MLKIKFPNDSTEENGKHIPENRKTKRMIHKGTIMLCDDSTEYYSYAQVGNVSGDGMYFESDYGFKQGRKIYIRRRKWNGRNRRKKKKTQISIFKLSARLWSSFSILENPEIHSYSQMIFF